MHELLVVIGMWLAANFALPEAGGLPRVEIVPAATMAALRDERSAARAEPAALAAPHGASAFQVEAQYDDAGGTIYLLDGWTAASVDDLSVLVHEMVHYLQAVGGENYDCPEAREALAYRAQARWLELFGRTLADSFGLDPMTLLVRTHCLR